MKKETLATKAGRDPEQHAGAVNPPVYRTSTVIFPTQEAYDEAEKGKAQYDEQSGGEAKDLSYGISGTPTTFALQQALAELEGGDHCVIVPSGLSAITTVLLSFVRAGDHILVSDAVYGPTRRFCNKELKKFGVETEYYDPLIGEGIGELIRDNTALIFLESPSSLTFEVQDVPAITAVAKEKDITTIFDNSWASPLNFQPFEYGVDVSIQALTKYVGGHSDLILGAIISKDSHYKKINRIYRNLGITTSPEDCALALRGLRTLPTRLKQHQESATKIAEWLEEQDRVAQVLYPALPSDPGHEFWKRDFSGANGLISFVLDQEYPKEKVAAFVNNLEHFAIGCSWGGFESLILVLDPNEARTATKFDAEGSFIRIHVGLEDADDLIADLEAGLGRL